jgi:TRAP-type C4-dicarboxylate transport system permease small subunit
MATPRLLDRALGLLCAVPVALIVALTFADVFARYLFAAPIRGSIEIIEFAMALLIFTALPLVTRHRGHVTVSLIDGVVRGTVRRLKAGLCDAVSTLALALMAWRLWVQAGGDLDAGNRTMMLGLPHAPLVYAMATLAALSALLMATLTWHSLRGTEERP